MGRYGTKSSFFNGASRAVPSLPDFEGVTQMGVQFLIEAKCIDTSVLPIHTRFLKQSQVVHLAQRADWNVPSMVLVHHYGRTLKTKTVPTVTMCYPVHRKCEWVQRCLEAYKAGEEPQGSIPPALWGFEVPWIKVGKARNPGPDLQLCIERSRGIILFYNTVKP